MPFEGHSVGRHLCAGAGDRTAAVLQTKWGCFKVNISTKVAQVLSDGAETKVGKSTTFLPGRK